MAKKYKVVIYLILIMLVVFTIIYFLGLPVEVCDQSVNKITGIPTICECKGIELVSDKENIKKCKGYFIIKSDLTNIIDY